MRKASVPAHPYFIERLKDPDYAIAYVQTVCEKDEELSDDEHLMLIKEAIASIIEAYGGNHAAFRSPEQLARIEKSWAEWMDSQASK